MKFLNRIDDEIIVSISESRVCVADFSGDKNGPRDAVCFESGYAMGFGLPTFYTCKKGERKNVNFDQSNYPIMPWEEDKL